MIMDVVSLVVKGRQGDVFSEQIFWNLCRGIKANLLMWKGERETSMSVTVPRVRGDTVYLLLWDFIWLKSTARIQKCGECTYITIQIWIWTKINYSHIDLFFYYFLFLNDRRNPLSMTKSVLTRLYR